MHSFEKPQHTAF